MWEMIHGEAKQTCRSARMDGTGREGTKATFQKQNARYNDLKGAEADTGSFKTKSSSLRDHNWSQTTAEKEFSAALIESSGLARTLTRSCRPRRECDLNTAFSVTELRQTAEDPGAACPLWVISGHTDKSAPCPLFAQ
jgi:hypothetical protein